VCEVLDANQVSSNGTRKKLNERLTEILNQLPVEEKEEEKGGGDEQTGEQKTESDSLVSNSSTVTEMIVDFENQEMRSRGLSVEDVLLKRTTSIKEEQTGQEDNEEISKNPMPTEDA